ncbi:class I SAM-dependent methyltransferase [Actinomadura geliboluensis]|uniref:Class I SAM-dependent methyltransferase n=1 Tax=Actinomadura geliboluensis TaxID=882440 RepID=A0A5S4HAP6_9ACTN|nr:class I SAM-dependent methyltransferase [Actinomadura geliboluensis]TMR42328.1 class I SAM-dependent methyltransferase [Actinomadura geliboluensis]
MTRPAACSVTDRAHIDVWREVYDHLYRAPWGALGEDFSGWDSSYDGSPIPTDQMREWRDTTVARVLALRPERVLEIGVGSGLLLSRIAPHCTSYTGTDLSPVAVETLGERLRAERPELAGRVELRTLPAHETGLLPAAAFDVVILNSVVQYFPSLAHLADVLTTAVSRAGPGGAVFVGDVRNRSLQKHFATAVARARGVPEAGLPDAIRHTIAQDRELLIDPDWFPAFARDLGTPVEIRLKQGTVANELTRYRYDVTLAGPNRPVIGTERAARLRWGDDVTSVEALSHMPDVPVVHIVGVPNRRLTGTGPQLDGPAGLDRSVPPGRRAVLTWSDTGPEAVDVLLVDRRLGDAVVVTCS